MGTDVSVLLVDDERSLRESCAALLRAQGFSVQVCSRGDDALRTLRSRSFDLALVDLHLPRISGLEVLAGALEANPDTIVVIMTQDPSVESSVNALSSGAWDYLPKPFSATHFDVLMGRAAHTVRVSRAATAAAQTRLSPTRHLVNGLPLYGESTALSEVLSLAEKVARTDASVFITGESGTGKELIANYIHQNSRRANRKLVALNCAAIPEALLESEMFGHVKGAFTGAIRDKEGLLEVSNGGTLFLDELTELPSSTQAKLLRVLQDGVVRRVGSTKTDAVVDVRFIAATNRDPLAAIEDGTLREDLHYRLRVVPIHIPPLRDRPEDIPVLAREFLKEFWAQHRDPRSPLPEFSEAALSAMKAARWHGNVRELRNVVEHAVVLAEPGAVLDPADVTFEGAEDCLAQRAAKNGFPGPDLEDMDYHAAREHILAQFELEYISRVIQRSGGNISNAARIAGVDRTTLYRIMEKHGMEREALAKHARTRN